jgi:HEAT repeat protein
MLSRILAFILICSSAIAAELPPAFDANDLLAVQTALRGIKMSPRDLSFKKDIVDCELVLQKSRLFLQQPLMLPAYGHQVITNLQSVSSLVGLADFSREQLEVPLAPIGEGEANVQLDAEFLKRLPPAVAEAVQTITHAASFAQLLLQQSLPIDKQSPFAAFALDAFHLDQDKGELQSWQQLGIDTGKIRDLLTRDQNLELQDSEAGDALLSADDRFYPPTMFVAFEALCRAVDAAIVQLRSTNITEEFEFSTDTPLGRIICGGGGRNIYTNEAFLIIDTGGDDVYLNSAGGANGLAGRPISIVIDLGGNDQFLSRHSFSQGSGVFGIGILAALGSNSTFIAKHLSQGVGFFGCGLLMTGQGKQTFEADTFCQGAGEFGAGILWQRGGDTMYRASEMAQGFGGTGGVGLLLDESGNDLYYAGGKYPCPWLPGEYFSLSQGFAYGMRPFAGGGVGILCDLKGDDRYVADVYGQGASYWYSTGLLLDAAGNDVYQAHQYCQGAGIHLSSGLLVDWGGDDEYSAAHICQGAAHDYSVGILIDRAGNDRYTGLTTAQGAAINNSFALLLDKSGDDFYAGRDAKQSQATGHDGGKREYGSVALLLDLAGNDVYSQGQTNNEVWLKPLYGAGLDGELTNKTVAAQSPIEPFSLEHVTVPHVGRTRYEPVDVHAPIERLMRRSIHDASTEQEREDSEAAWKELKQRGLEALPYLLTRLDSPNVALRSKIEDLIDAISTNAAPLLMAGIDNARNDEIARVCCYFLARFETATNAIPHVLPLLEREKTRTTAFYTLGHLRAHQAFGPALAALSDADERVRLRAAQALGLIGDPQASAKLIGALNDVLWDVRYAAENALVTLGKQSIGPLRAACARSAPRARPHIIEALARLGDRRALSLADADLRGEGPLIRKAVEQQLSQDYQESRSNASSRKRR